MCYDAKSSLTGWWILAFMSLFLWYRNQCYDRVLAAFVFTIGLIQLLEYGVWSAMDSGQAGKLIFIVLWLQAFVFTVGVYWYLHNTASTLVAVIFTVAFIIALLYALLGNGNFLAIPTPGGHVDWSQNGGGILGKWGWLYLLGISLPLILLLAASQWRAVSVWILLAYGIITALVMFFVFPRSSFASMWCYVAVGFAFIAWMIGVFHPVGSAGKCLPRPGA